ncbi:hypothetical protein [Rhodobacter maris]|uniref:Uncharacterized protein n=1 Tax=Rhodobacter maris TaxID=446682 RepID=A0A285TM74_9RHOB|nr:hypothetical protein [Rhodobacter maris]SOC21591.1 hypothetical protein SAMN05877831_1249 [Rhodobacter maris]
MKQLLLATALIAVPVIVFSGVEHYVIGPKAADTTVQAATLPPAASLGDMSAFATIVSDTQKIAASGDLKAAEARITDLETAWDEQATALRAQAPVLWGNVDASADAAFSALRAKAPDAARVDTALNDLAATLADPSLGAAEGGAAQTQHGIAVTDAAGHPLPCEVMLSDLRDGIAAGRASGAAQQVTDLQTKALERCNADDDRRADDFSAQALALLTPATASAQVTK